jgi:serine/threonine protein kinase
VVKGSAAEPGLVGEVAIKKYFELNPTMWRREGIHNLEVANARRVIFKEAAMMALVDSPNIPKVYAVTEGRADTLPRVVMELKSFNLQEVIHYDLLRRGRGETVLTLDFIRSMFIGLLKALKCLHGHTPPIVHYDIKEENVLLGTGCGRKEELSGDDVALADFGCARFKIECVDALKVPCAGNMKYKAPEVYAGVVNCSADIFSLCYMVCTVLCECDPGRGGGLLSISVEEISMKACGILQRTDPTFASVLLSGCSAEANLRGTASSILILMGITE